METFGHAYSGGLYFSEAMSTAGSSSYAKASGQYNTDPVFVLEAAGGPGTWTKTPSICTSLFKEKYHAQLQQLGRSPFANGIIIRGVFMDSARAGSPSTSDTAKAREYFESAQAAYDVIVGAHWWKNSDVHLLDIVGPSQGLQSSAVQP